MEIEIEIIKNHKAGLKVGQKKSYQEPLAKDLINLGYAKYFTGEKEVSKPVAEKKEERQVVSRVNKTKKNKE
jgi:hypothetical protein